MCFLSFAYLFLFLITRNLEANNCGFKRETTRRTSVHPRAYPCLPAGRRVSPLLFLFKNKPDRSDFQIIRKINRSVQYGYIIPHLKIKSSILRTKNMGKEYKVAFISCPFCKFINLLLFPLLLQLFRNLFRSYPGSRLLDCRCSLVFSQQYSLRYCCYRLPYNRQIAYLDSV